MCHPVECVEFCGRASRFSLLGAPPFIYFHFCVISKHSWGRGVASRPESRVVLALKWNLEVFISRFIITVGRRFISLGGFFSRSDPIMSYQEMSKLFESK